MSPPGYPSAWLHPCGASGKAVTQTFEWQAELANNDTANSSATLNVVFGSGATKPIETGLQIASDGLITFAPGHKR
jgi:hypothetical protein